MFELQIMSEIQRRRKKFIQEIKRQDKQQYFKMRRELLLQSQQTPINSKLRYFLKKSLANNGLSQEIEETIHQLRESIQHSDFNKQYEYVIAICSNILIDDLTLHHKEALANVLYQVYSRLESQRVHKNDKAIFNIAYSLPNFVIVLPCLHEGFALDCESLAYKLSVQIIQSIVDCDFTDSLRKIAEEIMQAWINLVTYEPEYKPQLELNFRLNISYYQQFLAMHSQLLRDQQREHCLIIRKGLLKIFEILTLQIDLTSYSIIFESQQFISFVIQQIINAGNSSHEKMGLNILTCLFIDNQKIECENMLDQMSSIFKERIELIFKNLLNDDENIEYRMKLLKIILSVEKYYNKFVPFFQHYWKQIVEHCINTMRNLQILSLSRFSIQVLLLLNERLSYDSLLNHLRNLGAQSLFDHLLMEMDQIRDQQVKQEVQKFSSELSHLLYALKQQ